MSAYKKRVSYEFEIMGNTFSIESDGKNADHWPSWMIEETRKNGQEDCHQLGVIYKDDFGYHWQWGDDSFSDYGNVSGEEILEFIKDNPLPEELNP